jgi:hypothetical protein
MEIKVIYQGRQKKQDKTQGLLSRRTYRSCQKEDFIFDSDDIVPLPP